MVNNSETDWIYVAKTVGSLVILFPCIDNIFQNIIIHADTSFLLLRKQIHILQECYDYILVSSDYYVIDTF